MPAPTYRGQGNGPFNQARPTKPSRRGQEVPYDINGKPQGPITGALADGTYGDVTVSGTGAVFTVLKAAKLTTARSITASGDAAWTVTFDGSANVSAGLVLATVNSNTGTFGGATTSAQISVNGKGLITGVSAVTITPAWTSITGRPTTLSGYGITDAQGLNANLTAISGLTTAADKLAYWTGAGTAALISFPSAARTALATLSGTNTGDQTITLTGDVTGSGTGSFGATIAAGAVTLAKMANLAANSILGNNTGSAATPIALTAAQVKTLLAIASTDVSGLGTAATVNTGTSGATIPLLSTANTWTLLQTFSANIQLGNTTPTSTATPRTINLGATYSSTAGANLKLRLYDDVSTVFGFGISAGQIDYVAASGIHAFYIGASIIASIGTTGLTITGVSNSTGDQLISGTGKQGYTTGSGGTVTQLTSKATGVTLNKTNGQIVTHNAALAAAAVVSFVVTNSTIAATDTINLNLASGNATAGTYRYWIDKVSAGSFVVAMENRSAGSLSEALTFNFAALKAVTS